MNTPPRLHRTVCQAVQCPAFQTESEGYGCQLYSDSIGCHLLQENFWEKGEKPFELTHNQYAVFAEDSREISPEEAALLKRKNQEFLRKDPRFQERLRFQKDNPTWMEGEFHFGELGELDE